MIAKPWELDAKALQRIAKLPAEQRPYGFISYRHYNSNTYKLPFIFAFLIYGLFLLLIISASINNLLAWGWPSLHAKLKRKLRLLRAHVLEHPLIHRKHASVVSFPFVKWLTLQLPLRGEAVVVFLYSLLNFLPLVAFYDLYVSPNNTLYPGPTGKRDQICRHLADRTAILGVAQLPLLILMASKRTPLAIMAGLGMNSLMLYHRWIARWFWLHILIHTAGFTAIYIRRPGGVTALLEHNYVTWGIVGLSMMFGLVFFSLRTLRQRHYEIFVMLHITMAFFAMLGTYLHIALIRSPKFQIFVVITEISASIWAFDRFARLVSRIYLSFSSPRLTSSSSEKGSALVKCATGEISTFGCDSNYTRLRISVPASKLRLANQSRLMSGIAAGDDIRITIPRLQWVGEHPFTVFAVGTQPEDPTQGYIDLLIKTEAGLTRKLAEHAGKSTKNGSEEKDVEMAGASGKKGRVAVLIEGPFGIIPNIQEATDLVLVSGGIAITFCWPLFVAAIHESAGSKLKSCKVIWIVRNQKTLSVVKEAFSELVKKMEEQQSWKGCRFSIDIYITSQKHAGFGVSTGPGSMRTLPSSRSSSTNSIKEKYAVDKPQAGESSIPTSELTAAVAELPMVAQQVSSQDDDTEREDPFSDGADGNLIKVTLHGGRPDDLNSALFGHLNNQYLQESTGLTVGLCGPPSLCDDVRAETVALLKKGINVELLEDCFTW